MVSRITVLYCTVLFCTVLQCRLLGQLLFRRKLDLTEIGSTAAIDVTGRSDQIRLEEIRSPEVVDTC
jgi:hypothetical protein